MVQLINLGGIKNVNGKNVLNGSNSGIDTAGLVDALAKAKALPAVNMQTRITANKQKITALNQMKTLMGNLQTSLNALRNPVGLDADKNAFGARITTLGNTTNTTATGPTLNIGGDPGSDYLNITKSTNAPTGDYAIGVTQLAAKYISTATFTDGQPVFGASPGQLAATTYTINGDSTRQVTLDGTEDLNAIAQKFNNGLAGLGNATVIDNGDGTHSIKITADKTGIANAISVTDSGSTFNSAFTVTQPPLDATITVNGVTKTSPSNTFSDAIENASFQVIKPTSGPGTDTFKLTIAPDAATAATAIGNMLDAYNALRQFQAQQKQRDANGNLVKTAVLNNDPTMSTIIDRLSALIGSQAADAIPDTYRTNSDPVAPVKLGDLGISLGDIAATDDITNADGTITTGSPGIRNVLQIDVTKLDASLKNNFADVAKIFQFGFTSSSANLSSYKHDNTVIDSKFTISVDNTQPPGQQAKITAIDGAPLATPVYLTYALDSATNQYKIKGQAGTAFADIDITYSGNGNSTFDQSATLDSKALTISMDKTQPVGSQAKITSIYGAVLATPISLVYTASSTASGIVSGAPGSGYEGLQLLYTGDTPESVNISMSQGIADISYNDLSSMLGSITGAASTSTGGLVDAAVTNLQDSDAKLQTSIDRINDQVTSYREQLLNRFSKLEAAIGSANQLLTLLSAQSDARNNS